MSYFATLFLIRGNFSESIIILMDFPVDGLSSYVNLDCKKTVGKKTLNSAIFLNRTIMISAHIKSLSLSPWIRHGFIQLILI